MLSTSTPPLHSNVSDKMSCSSKASGKALGGLVLRNNITTQQTFLLVVVATMGNEQVIILPTPASSRSKICFNSYAVNLNPLPLS